MNKTCTYRVAGHCFQLSLPDNEKLWDAVGGPYQPFIVENGVDENVPQGEVQDVDEGLAGAGNGGAHCDDILFRVEMVEQLPECEMTCIYDHPTEDGETVVKLYKMADGSWFFETSADHRLPTCAKIWASHDFRTAKLQLMTHRITDAVFGINNAAMLLYAFSSACTGTIEMHASVIENGGKAYLFLGKSGTGKSTHSSLWLKHIEGSTLMNDDNPIVRVWEDGRVIAYGSPWSGKTPCYKNVEAPVGAYVQIRQCPENKIRRMSVLEAYSSLFSSISGIKDDNSKMADGLNDTLSRILATVPCYLLDCRPDEDAALLSSSTVR